MSAPKPSSPNQDIPLGRLLRWYLGHYRRDLLRIGSGAVLALLQSGALVPIPLLFQRIIDVHIPAGDMAGVWRLGAAAAGLYLLHGLMSFGSTTLTLLATKRVTEGLRARLCMQLQQMSLRFHDAERASELHSRVVLDTERIDIMGNAVTVFAVSSAMMFLIAASLLAWLNLTLFGITMAVLPVYFIVFHLLRSRMQRASKSFRNEMETMNSQVNDLIQSIRLVKTFAREDHEQREAEEQFRKVTHSALDMTIFNAFFGASMGWLNNMATLVLYVAGAWMIVGGRLTIGELVAFVGMVGFLINPVTAIMNMMPQIYSGVASLGPVYALLHFNEPLEVFDGKMQVGRLEGRVEFDNVSLVYDSNGRHAVRGVSMSVQPGETIALVGESGAGKSTLVNMVLGFYLPSDGVLRIDGRDVRELDLRNLRERIGVVSQDNVLLNTSIRENLKYGRMEATDDQVCEAARLAHALDFVDQLPGGFDAEVGDRGVRLSGGQRQRLAIARALLKDPQILILDEATSALDSESEAKIQEALEHLQKGRTCFVIAHRLSTVVKADRIVVMREGRIAEQGTHAELLAHGGDYARLCEKQFGAVTRLAPPTASLH